jgi:hypothetical protein
MEGGKEIGRRKTEDGGKGRRQSRKGKEIIREVKSTIE